jgi:DNA-binding MarR family transcriptional regulator
MSKKKSLYTDHEYIIMQEIADNENVTQRELSKHLGVSLGTINVLMNKMVREGVIKMTQVSQKQVLYMLTPMGMMAKAKKTVSYLKAHYKAIDSSKQTLKKLLNKLNGKYKKIYIFIEDQDIREVIDIVIHEINRTNILIECEFIDNIDKMDWGAHQESILVYLEPEDTDNSITLPKNMTQLNLLEYL